MFFLKLRPEIKEFANRLVNHPEKFRVWAYSSRCEDTGATLNVNADGTFSEIETFAGTFYRNHLYSREIRVLERAHRAAVLKKAEKECTATLSALNPVPVVKPNE